MSHRSKFDSWQQRSSSHFLLATLIFSHAQGLSTPPFLRRIRSLIPQKLPLSLPWYEDGLDFSCTGCSKCCQVDGDVWLAPEETSSIVKYLGDNLSIDMFRKKYVKAEITPANGDRSESWLNLKRNDGACIFLDPSGKCGIYEVRPVQCSTYPFWPSLLEDADAWKEEAVLPDEVAIEEESLERHWSPELGGCEGIGKIIDAVALVDKDSLGDVDLEKLYKEHREVQIVERKEIQARRKQAKKHWDRFPVEEIKMNTWYL